MTCSICHDDSCACSCALNCGHTFGLSCVGKWIHFQTSSLPAPAGSGAVNATCPECRDPISRQKEAEVVLLQNKAWMDALDSLYPVYHVLSDC